jgi:sugar phosphate isomerase/epimerase
MKIYASTTFLGASQTNLSEPLSILRDLDLDGVELGSTHFWQSNLRDVVSKLWNKNIITHNYFPPSSKNLVLNIASRDPKIRTASIEHMKICIRFASDIGAKIYTIHPGFLAEPLNVQTNIKEKSFDFSYSSDAVPYETAFMLMKNALIELIKVANEVDVSLAIETEGSLTSTGVALMEDPAEYENLFNEIKDGLYLNLNLSHTLLAAKGRGFTVDAFINRFKNRIIAVELSDNDGYRDQHRPLNSESQVLNWIPYLPDVPLILEFRCATKDDIINSISILRNTENVGTNK